MKKKHWIYIIVIICIILFIFLLLYGKSRADGTNDTIHQRLKQEDINPSDTITLLEEGLSVVRYHGDYGFQKYLDAGGASSDEEVVDYLMNHVLINVSGLQFSNNGFGCSTIQTKNVNEDILFGRNFDWSESESLIIQSNPVDDYASISTVNLDFIQNGTAFPLKHLPDSILAQIALYAPLDGMNEKGLAISVNMIEDTKIIHQNKQLKNLTTTTAIRAILNKAANVDEAIALLQEYNLHSSMDKMIHFAIADANGRSVVVEYIQNEMHVIDTPVVTNFYLSEGDKFGIGSSQSHERYNILMDIVNERKELEMNDVRDALDRVSKDNFNEFESTEWSLVYNLNQKEIHYYHRENYDHRFVFHLNEEEAYQ